MAIHRTLPEAEPLPDYFEQGIDGVYFLDDIDDLIKLLGEECESTTLRAGGYLVDFPADLRDATKEELESVLIVGEDPDIWIDLSRIDGSVATINPTQHTRQAVTAIAAYMDSRRQEHWRLRLPNYRATIIDFIILLAVMLFVAVALSQATKDPLIFLLANVNVTAAGFVILRQQIKRKTRPTTLILPMTRREFETQRGKHTREIMIALSSAVVGAALAAPGAYLTGSD